MLPDLAVRYPFHRDGLYAQPLARWRDATEFALVRAFQLVAYRPFVALGDHFLDNGPEITHPPPEHGPNRPDALRALRLVANPGAVVDVVGRQQLLGQADIAFTPHTPELAHDGLVFLCRHKRCLLSLALALLGTCLVPTVLHHACSTRRLPPTNRTNARIIGELIDLSTISGVL